MDCFWLPKVRCQTGQVGPDVLCVLCALPSWELGSWEQKAAWRGRPRGGVALAAAQRHNSAETAPPRRRGCMSAPWFIFQQHNPMVNAEFRSNPASAAIDRRAATIATPFGIYLPTYLTQVPSEGIASHVHVRVLPRVPGQFATHAWGLWATGATGLPELLIGAPNFLPAELNLYLPFNNHSTRYAPCAPGG